MDAEELMRELFGTAPGDGRLEFQSLYLSCESELRRGPLATCEQPGASCRMSVAMTSRTASSSHARMSVGALISRVGVRVGAFGAHPPISTQTCETRLLCDRTFPVRTEGERVLGIPNARLTGKGRGCAD